MKNKVERLFVDSKNTQGISVNVFRIFCILKFNAYGGGGGRGKALVAGPLKKNFCLFQLTLVH